MVRRYAEHEDRLAPPKTAADARARAEQLAVQRGYLVEPEDRRALAFARARGRRRRVVTVLAAVAAVVVVTVAVAVTRPSTHHQPNGSGAPAATPHPTTATPLTASRVAQMLVDGQFAAIASEIEPPSRRSGDQAVLKQAWGDLTNAFGTLVSTGTQYEDSFPLPAFPASPGAVVDKTVLQMSYGLILLRVTLSPDGALVHVELQPWPTAPFDFYIGQSFGF
jgi:hypothetical protein